MEVGPSSRFSLQSKIGAGGYSVVYRAHDRLLDEVVALKILRLANPSARMVAIREVRVARKITHPNVVRLYDAEIVDSAILISMEYVEGRSLRVWREDHSNIDDIRNVFVGVCQGLSAAHDRGVVHRDLKPENILVEDTGRVVLCDFGLAVESCRSNEDGRFRGTPAYVSPEQARGEATAPASDIYSLGIVMWEMFSGELLFRGRNATETIMKRFDEVPRKLTDIPPDIADTISRCLSHDRTARPTANEILEILNADAARSSDFNITRTTDSILRRQHTPVPTPPVALAENGDTADRKAWAILAAMSQFSAPCKIDEIKSTVGDAFSSGSFDRLVESGAVYIDSGSSGFRVHDTHLPQAREYLSRAPTKTAMFDRFVETIAVAPTHAESWEELERAFHSDLSNIVQKIAIAKRCRELFLADPTSRGPINRMADVLLSNTSSREALTVASDIYIALNKPTQAYNALQIALENSAAGDMFDLLVQLAGMARNIGRLDEALELINRAEKRSVTPDQVGRAWGVKAAICRNAGKFDEARTLLRQVEELHDRHVRLPADFVGNLAFLGLQDGNIRQSARFTGIALETALADKQTLAHNFWKANHAKMLRLLGEYDVAHRCVDEAIQAMQTFGNRELCMALSTKGDLLLDQRRPEEAKHVFDQVLASAISLGNQRYSAIGHLGIARATQQVGDIERALVMVRTERSPTPQALMRIHLAATATMAGNIPLAESLLELEIDASNLTLPKQVQLLRVKAALEELRTDTREYRLEADSLCDRMNLPEQSPLRRCLTVPTDP